MTDRLQPALWGGLFIGVLSALPIVNTGNCCCCLWVLCGGVLATYLRQQQSPLRIDAAEGALVGLMAGLVGGIIASLLSIPMQMFVGPYQQQLMERILASNPDVPAEARDAVRGFASGTGFRLVGMIVSVVIYVIFGMLGGLLGVAIFKKSTPPPPGTVEILPPA
jgi:uncharacterized protein DUF5518